MIKKVPDKSGLESAREVINDVDKKIAELFERRMDAVRAVAQYKIENGIPIEDSAREELLIKRNCTYIKDETYLPFYISYQRHVMKVSKDFQRQLSSGMRIAFCGEPGAFAENVAKRIFPQANTVPYPDFKSAYRSVENGECGLAFLPIENSFNGDVGSVMDLAFFGKLYISGIYGAEIVQNLLAQNGARLSDIKKVISHPQALGQCAPYIEKHGFETEEAVSTSSAAKLVSELKRKDVAAIASKEAAELFGLSTLESHINESGSNSTRFAVFTPYERKSGNTVSSFVLLFTVRDSAGALGEAVSVIGKHGFNLRALKSRPTKELVWNYYFYAEGDGNIESKEGKLMLDELGKYCNTIKIVGSF